MSLFQAIFLAIVQGLTEFLPVSSSGHLVLFQKIFGIDEPPVFFDILLHLGTLGAILFFFKNEIIDLIVNFRKRIKIWFLIIIGSIPAVITGYFLNSKISEIFGSIELVGVMWIIFGLLLLSLKFVKNKTNKEKLHEISFVDAFVVGLFQATALFPGISRSGSTVTGGLLKKLSPSNAFTFSFLLSIPAILGAVILKVKEIKMLDVNVGLCLLSMIIAGIIGFFILRVLKKILVSEKFYFFGIYCFVLGLIILLTK